MNAAHAKSLPGIPLGKTGWPWDVNSVPVNDFAGREWPRITIITPSYNQGDFLEETIRSVLLQGYPNLEYIVVDGGSTDHSGDVIDKYSSYIDHIICEPDEGQSDAIVKGLRHATGAFFNWINSDDLLLPGVLYELGKQFTKAIDLYTFRVIASGVGIESYEMKNRNLSAKAILKADRYSFSQPGLWFRTEQVRDCGGIDRNFNYSFDWDLLIRYLSQNPRVGYSSSKGAMFRLHLQSKTILESKKVDPQENRFWQEGQRVRDKLEGSLPVSLRVASCLGRQREPWNQYLIEILDAPDRSPLISSLTITGQALKNPRVRCSARTFGSIARLLSRYVRPSFYRQTDGASKQ